MQKTTEDLVIVAKRIVFDFDVSEERAAIESPDLKLEWPLVPADRNPNFPDTPCLAFKDDPWAFRHRFPEDFRVGQVWTMRHLFDKVEEKLRKKKIILCTKDRNLYRRPEYLKSGLYNRISPSEEGWDLIDKFNVVGGTFEWLNCSFVYKAQEQLPEHIPVDVLTLMMEIVERRRDPNVLGKKIKRVEKGFWDLKERRQLKAIRKYGDDMEECLPILSNRRY